MNGKSGKKPQTEFIRDKRGKMQLVSKCHGREVRKEGSAGIFLNNLWGLVNK
jgi:hypothetical protein